MQTGFLIVYFNRLRQYTILLKGRTMETKEIVCDKCKTTDGNSIDYGHIDIEGKQAFQECSCDCGHTFFEVYKFSHRQTK